MPLVVLKAFPVSALRFQQHLGVGDGSDTDGWQPLAHKQECMNVRQRLRASETHQQEVHTCRIWSRRKLEAAEFLRSLQ